MDVFTVNWEMIDPTDTKVTMTLQGDAANVLETLRSRKSIIEKALEQGWTFNTNPLGQRPRNNNGQQSGGGQARTCQHGEMKWKTGTSRKSGKPYKGYFCSANECPPQFIADRGPRQNYSNEPPEYGEYR